ncbi:VIT domain-containing protein [Haloferula chungangensis]|uniref:VIT domain-containing protein n=1 Tax=Haloferula chungangensis TaxID=1048331 RepID=A0ABW2L9B3_9BACT
MQTPTILHAVTLSFLSTGLSFALPQPHPDGDDDQTHAPHFEISGDGKTTEQFPLKSTDVKATISGVIAQVQVEQTYSNTGSTPIEATYVFPASTRAAVHGVEMKIGERVIIAEIQEKAQAKATYEKAKSQNKTASLLDQERPNVFKMSVANILPGDEVTVTLNFSEKLTATDRVYEFVYPTVVGPRYSNKGAETETWVGNPHLSEGVDSPATFAAEVQVQSGMPLQSLTCTSHQPTIEFTAKDQASVSLPPSGEAGNRDFVLRYRLADAQVASGLLLHEGEDDNFFLLNVEPPARVLPEQIPARDYVFILDTSGSMNGFPLDTAKLLMRDLLGGIRQTDTFNVLLFAGDSRILSETPLQATPENIARGTDLTRLASGGGSTELLPALKRAMALPKDHDTSRSIVVVTDGFVNIERETFDLVQSELGNANLFAFGIGSSVNRWLIEGMARAGMGEPFFVLHPGEASQTASRFRDYIASPVLTDIKVRYEGFEAVDVQPESFPDVFADRPIELIGKWKGGASGRIIITGQGGAGPYEASFDVSTEATKGMKNPALRPLWAREKVRSLADRSMINSHMRGSGAKDETKREITTLGLTYSLLTDYTSFVGVDETPREVLDKLATVAQPLPLPKGVSNQAVGSSYVTVSNSGGSPGTTGAVPEPSAVGLLMITAIGLLMHRHRQKD